MAETLTPFAARASTTLKSEASNTSCAEAMAEKAPSETAKEAFILCGAVSCNEISKGGASKAGEVPQVTVMTPNGHL